jgi:hypothetical protein
MLLRRGPAGSARGRSGWMVAFLLVLTLAAGGLAACGGSSGTASTSDEGGGAAATTPATAAAPDYTTLLTQDDVRGITGRADATPMPESDWGERAGDSKYFAIYQGKDWPEALWLRVGRASMFEEQRGASDKPAVAISGLGDDAFWWEYSGMQRGIAILVGDSTYEVISGYAWNKPQVTDDQLLEVAKTVVGRL